MVMICRDFYWIKVKILKNGKKRYSTNVVFLNLGFLKTPNIKNAKYLNLHFKTLRALLLFSLILFIKLPSS